MLAISDRPISAVRWIGRPQFRDSVVMSSKTIETRAHTTKDGRLNLSVDVEVADVDVAVVVTVTSVTARSPVDGNGWPEGFFDVSSRYEYLHFLKYPRVFANHRPSLGGLGVMDFGTVQK